MIRTDRFERTPRIGAWYNALTCRHARKVESPLLVRIIVLLVTLSGTLCTNVVAQPNPVTADVWEPFPHVAQLEPRQLIAPQPAVSPTLYPNEQRVRIYPRGSAGWQGRWFPGNAGERIAVIDSGVNIVINNVSGFSAVEISTDRLVVWTSDDAMGGLQLDGGDDGSVQPADVPLELYMEGNIVFQEGERIIFADRMYYNVQTRSGVILNSEMLTSMAGYRGKVRLKAEVLQQVDPDHFQGFNAGFTTSRLGVPRYWLQSGEFLFEDMKRPVVDPITGYPASDPFTGEPLIEPERQVVSRNNRVYLNEWPVFAWPSISTDLNRPTFYLESFSINNDSVFGTQVLSEWNLYQLLGFKNPPKGTTWTGSVDYLSERGLGLGTNFRYSRPGFLGHAGNTRGFIDVWGINDSGLDNLGADRRALVPEEDFRGRIFGRHRQDLDGGFRVTGEVGWASDRNFLEQYYEQEWDNLKDQSTGVELKRTIENRSWSIAGDMQVNDFFTQTEWLPRLDHYWLGQPVFGDWLTWHEHSSIGYGHLRTADAPLDPADARKFDPLAWEADAEGLRAVSRQEINAPLLLGPFKFAPYALGEAAYWHEDLSANELERMYGQLGVRASIPFWRVNPAVQSQLFNLNGLAHKIVYEAEFFWAEADQDFQQLPLYDPLDDDSVEFFRRRFFFDTFNGVAGGDVPLEFDERTYALRSGMQGWVTSPSAEIADDLTAFRLGATHRWQTKRGRLGQQRVVDWITLQLNGFVYPDAERDNFGEELGLLSYNFNWHVGDRFTILSDGQADLFPNGLKTVSLSGVISRPGRGRYAAGLRSIEGPISSQILYSAASYRLSQKWIVNYGSSYDFGQTGNLGQSGQIVRIGESFLVGLGFRYDSSRDNLSIRFAVEPRFLSGRLGMVGGIPIEPVGTFGLQ